MEIAGEVTQKRGFAGEQALFGVHVAVANVAHELTVFDDWIGFGKKVKGRLRNIPVCAIYKMEVSHAMADSRKYSYYLPSVRNRGGLEVKRRVIVAIPVAESNDDWITPLHEYVNPTRA